MKQSDYRKPPVARVEKKVFEKFGIKREDEFFWLKDKTNPELIDYLNEENAYTKTVMESTQTLQDAIYDEIVSRIKEEDESYPYLDNGYYYYSRIKKGEQYSTHLRKKASLEAKEEILFDVNKMAREYSAFIFRDFEISPDNKLAAYTYNTTGSYAEFTLKIRDIESGQDLGFQVDGVDDFVWANDNKTLFYVLIDSTLRPYKVVRHNIVSRESEVVYEELDGRFVAGVSKDVLEKFIYIDLNSTTTSECRYLSADEPMTEPKIFRKRENKVDYAVTAHKDYFVIKYKDDDNLNSKVYLAPFNAYEDKATWTEIVPHREDVLIEDLLVLEKYIVSTTRQNGLKRLNIIFLEEDYRTETVYFPEAAYEVSTRNNMIFTTDKLRYIYSSLKRPSTLYDYDILSAKSETLKVQEIPCGFNPDDYVLERKMVLARDGARVPIELLYKRGLEKDANNPTLLYAYGSYGFSSNPSFSASLFSLVDRGYIFAMAHIRGGSEMGEKWYQDGKFLKKKNTFTDFIDCADYLVEQKYTCSERLAIKGGSAGGLLMGAVTNMRPDLFGCVLAIVPFVDVVTTMLDDSLPLTIGEYEEWGNPNEEEYFKYMLSYSPYDNIERKDYPNMLITGGLNDSQVLFHEPTKYTAKLRKYKTDDKVVLLHMDMDSGHGGATGRYSAIKDIALQYAFVLKFTGK